MTDLQKIIAEMADLEAEASINLNEVDRSVRAGAEGRVRQAKTRLDVLRRKYLNDITPHLVLIGVKGPAAEKFAQIASEKYNTIAVDYKFLPKFLLRKLEEHKMRGDYNQYAHWVIMSELTGIKARYDVARMASPAYSAIAPYNGKPLLEAVSIMLSSTYGASLDSAVLRREIGNAALKLRFNGSMLPVVLYNFDADIDRGIDTNVLPKPVALLNAAKNLSEAQVKSQLIKIRDGLAAKAVTKNTDETDQTESLVTDPETQTETN